MYCPKCGTKNDDNAFCCTACEEIIQPVPIQTRPGDIGDDAGMRMLLPVGRSWFAIAAGYAGLFALAIFPAPIALILGILAVWDISKHPGRHGMGRAVFAIITGTLGSIAIVMMILSGVFA